MVHTSQQFGDNIVCLECGVPKEPDKFPADSAICRHCTPKVLKRAELPISPHDRFADRYDQQLKKLRETSQNQMINGVHKGLEILDESPQEIMATLINEMRGVAPGQDGLSAEQIAALPKDYRTIGVYLKLFQVAQAISDKQLSDHGNPFETMKAEDLRAMMLKGTCDHIRSDCELRLQVIRTFVEEIPTFLNEVMQVAAEKEAIVA